MIIDGVNAGMSVQGNEINAADGAANFTRAITKPFARAGAAVAARDHLPKNTENTSDAFDSVHTGAELSGSRILVIRTKPLGRGMDGAVSCLRHQRPARLAA